MSSDKRSERPSVESVGFAKFTLELGLDRAREGTLNELQLAMRATNTIKRTMVFTFRKESTGAVKQ
jgi:hypothetical protein